MYKRQSWSFPVLGLQIEPYFWSIKYFSSKAVSDGQTQVRTRFSKEKTSNIWKRDCFPHLQTLNKFFVCRWNLLPGPLSRFFWEKSGCWWWSFNERPRRSRHGQACGSARKISGSLSARLQTGPGQTEIGKDEPGRIPLVWSLTFHVAWSLNYTSSGLRLRGVASNQILRWVR